MNVSLQTGPVWGALRQSNSYWKALEMLGLSWAEIASYLPPERDPQAGYDWQTLTSEEQTWKLFQGLGLSWAAFEILKPRNVDPDAGYTWLDIAAIAFVWQSLKEAGLTWEQITALVPSGHWDDLVTVQAVEGTTVLLQLNASRISTALTPKLKITYDPAQLSWTGTFLRENCGLKVADEDAILPTEVVFSDGELSFTYPKQVDGLWTGLVEGIPFSAKTTGEVSVQLS